MHPRYVCMLLIKCLKTQFLECHKWYDSVDVDELMNRHIMLGNWRMGRFLTAATIVESLFHFVSSLVRYITTIICYVGIFLKAEKWPLLSYGLLCYGFVILNM